MLRKIEIAGGAAGPRLLVTGGVHGDEYEPMVACRRLVAALCPAAADREGRLVGDAFECAALRGQVSVIPCVNEPAFVRGTRTADDGLDLARICPGNPTGSITEQIGHALSEEIRQADYYIDLHTGGLAYRIWPLAGYTLHPDPTILAEQRRMARAFNLPVIWGTSPALNGRSLSVARDAGVPAIYAEYQGGSDCRTDGVEAYLAGCLNVLGELGMMPQSPFESRCRYMVEDEREGSGHFQVKQPAPITGIFTPCVELGDRVGQGARLGVVHSADGRAQTDVVADNAGLVLMLPAVPRVVAGQATAAVLEVT